MRYLVTGAAGFIGSALARRLIAEGDDVVIVDSLITGFERNIPPEAIFIKGDLSDPATIAKIPALHYDGVLHLAAQSSGALGQKDPYADMQANVAATVLLIKWCAANGVKRFVHASSMTVYGRAGASPLPEDAVTLPISFYGAGKIASEHYLRIAALDGLRPTALRLYNVYGPGQNLGNLYQGMASIYLAYMLDEVAVPVTGSFERYRDFCYIDDVVEAFVRTVRMPETPHLSYNIGTGRKTTVRQLLDLLIGAMGLAPDYPVEELPGSANDMFGSLCDNRLAQAELGWLPSMPVTVGIPKMVDWAKQECARRRNI